MSVLFSKPLSSKSLSSKSLSSKSLSSKARPAIRSDAESSDGARLTATKRALLAMRKLQQRVQALESQATAPIAVIGIGCRFPGGVDDPEGFWNLLEQGVDAVGEVPRERFDTSPYLSDDPAHPGALTSPAGGFLDGIDRFEPEFFGISPREARQMDPQQRLLLEVAWEALERSGRAGPSLAGSATGVFVGITSSEYGHLTTAGGSASAIDSFTASGSSTSVAAGRLAYALGLHGPCLSIDTACSSSLVAVHLAVQSLRQGECEQALAGGVNLILSPYSTIALSQAGMLAPDGRCKAFDATADGFVRGEGCAAVVLKPLDRARRDRDPILAVIRGSAINHDGRSGGLTAPNGPMQEAVIRRSLQNAGATPDAISYVEAHGTGTALGDPIEAGALDAVFTEGRDDPLRIGSVKTNIGHLEAAGGVAGLIKVVLALRHGVLPPSLHFERPSPHIPWDRIALDVVRGPVPWSASTRLAGVSSFGFSGTNVHLVVGEAGDGAAGEASPEDDETPQLLVLSARQSESLHALAARWLAHFEARRPSWPAACATAALGRRHLTERLALVRSSLDGAIEALRAFLDGHPVEGLWTGRAKTSLQPRLDGSSADRTEASLAVLAQAYVDGVPILWDQVVEATMPRLDLPTYPFARKRYWSLEPASDSPIANEILPGRRLDPATVPSALAESGFAASVFTPSEPNIRTVSESTVSEATVSETTVFETHWDLATLPILKDHRIYDRSVVPGVVFLEMVLQGATQVFSPQVFSPDGRGRPTLQHVAFAEPLALPDDSRSTVRLAFGAASFGAASFGAATSEGIAFEIRSRLDGAESSAWSLHLRGRLTFSTPVADTRPEDLDALKAACGPPMSAETFYRQRILASGSDPDAADPRLGSHLGESFTWMEALWVGEDQALARIRHPDRKTHPGGPRPRPEVMAIDALFQLLAGVWPTDWNPVGQGFFLPFGLGELNVLDPPSEMSDEFWVLATRRHATERSLVGDVQLLDGAGRTLVRGRDLEVRQARALARPGPDVGAWFHDLEWEPITDLEAPSARDRPNWLLLVDGSAEDNRSSVEAELVQRLQGRGDVVHRVHLRAGQGLRSLARGGFAVDPRDPEAFADLLRAVGSEPLRIVHLSSLQEASSPTEARERILTSAFHLVQALLRQPESPELVLVTRGSQEIADQPVREPFGAMLWGLGRTLWLEQPEARCRLIDLDPSASAADQAAHLVRACEPIDESEPQIGIRNGRFYGPRLKPATPRADEPPRLDSEGTVLVTGGLGGLGQVVARWLLARGVRHLLLVGRTPREAVMERLAEFRAKVAEDNSGDCVGDCTVDYAAADLALENGAEGLLATLALWPPVRGIVHAAGVLADGLLETSTRDALETVTGPKLLGSWWLHRHFPDVEFFWTFSSIAGLFGSAAQGHYAAANAFQDALASYRRGLGQRGTSLAWGVWSEVGMGVAEDSAGIERARQAGMGTLSPTDGPAIFDRVAGSRDGTFAIAPIDGPALARRASAKSQRLLKHWQRSAPSAGPQQPDHAIDLAAWSAAPEADRLRRLTRHVHDRAVAVLGFDLGQALEDDLPLEELGLDSLLAVELKSGIEAGLPVRLPISDYLDGPSVIHLAKRLAEALDLENPVADAPPRAAEGALASPLIEIRRARPRPQIFAVPGAFGSPAYFNALAAAMPQEQAFSGFLAPGLDSSRRPLGTVEEIASHYLDAVRAVQSAGPYLICGHSLGGHIAYEMAQQLRASGQEVALLALLDTAVIRSQVEVSSLEPQSSHLIAGALHYLYNELHSDQFTMPYDELAQHPEEEQLGLLIEHLKTLEVVLPALDSGGLREVVLASIQAMLNYEPRPYDGAFAVFRAAEGFPRQYLSTPSIVADLTDPDLGWWPLARADLQVETVPGDHMTMLRTPHVEDLAERLEALIAEALNRKSLAR